MNQQKADEVRQAVRDSYTKVAEVSNAGGCCGPGSNTGNTGAGCCAPTVEINALHSTRFGYSEDDIGAVPAGADMGLGCGNPSAIASLKPGEVVLDLGSGGGFDCFLAAREVGATGRVIGVDMTPTMISKARGNAAQGDYAHVEFRLGEIEHLPVADASVDVIISNCVINLSPDKAQVIHETFRVLKPGGRLAIADVVASTELPDHIRNDMTLFSGCMAGASVVSELESYLAAAGFTDIRIAPKDASREFIKDWAPGRGVEDYVISATIEARRPM
jgi:SAM-dependent methyltransferase